LERKAVSGVMLALMLASMLTLTFSIQQVKAGGLAFSRSKQVEPFTSGLTDQLTHQ